MLSKSDDTTGNQDNDTPKPYFTSFGLNVNGFNMGKIVWYTYVCM